MSERTCSVDGCTQAHRARGLCSTHYNQQRYTTNQRHPKTAIPCDWCGKPAVKDQGRSDRYAKLFCSLSCRDLRRASDAGLLQCAVPLTHPAHPDYVPPLPVLWIAPTRQAIEPGPRRWVAGLCHRCSKSYIAEDYTNTARYCSLRCARRVSKQRYRARKKQAYVADVSPAQIFQRDGWRCKLCRRKVRKDKVVPHPLAPVLDHIVPLARGGTHEPSNVQCAHFRCNSMKSDSARYAEQLTLIG